MTFKKILAGIIAVLTLVKLTFLLVSPGSWLGATQAFLAHPALVTVVYLVLLAITGYVIFTSLDLIDIVIVMGFTAALVGLSLIPYAGALQKLTGDFVTQGFGKAWLAWVIWVVIAVAVLYRVFSRPKSGQD